MSIYNSIVKLLESDFLLRYYEEDDYLFVQLLGIIPFLSQTVAHNFRIEKDKPEYNDILKLLHNYDVAHGL